MKHTYLNEKKNIEFDKSLHKCVKPVVLNQINVYFDKYQTEK